MSHSSQSRTGGPPRPPLSALTNSTALVRGGHGDRPYRAINRRLKFAPPYYQQIPGCLEYPALVQALRHNPRAEINLRQLKARDFFDRGFVIVGSPRTVREQLLHGIKRLRIGHLLTLLHFGSMPTYLCKKNIDLFAREVLPYLEDVWDDKYEDRWWPERLRAKRPVAAVAAAS